MRLKALFMVNLWLGNKRGEKRKKRYKSGDLKKV